MSVSANMQNPSFHGIYKISMPNVQTIKDENEKNAVTEAAINTIVMGTNSSIEAPRISEKDSAIYYRINDKHDKDFEKGFREILNSCNKAFNVDLAKKVYMQRVSEEEYQKAEIVQ